MSLKTVENLKELYEKDFYLWVMENLRLLKEKRYEEVDWENLLEEIEDMGRSELRSVISYISIILEHLYKLENFKVSQEMGNSWIKSIINAREGLELMFDESPSLRGKAQQELEKSWRIAVKRLIAWFEYPENIALAKRFFGRLPTEKDFPSKCPYTFEQLLSYRPWIKEED